MAQFYHLQLKEGLRTWTIKKRYSEFQALYRDVRRVTLVSLPSASYVYLLVQMSDTFKDNPKVVPVFPQTSLNPISPSSESIRTRQAALQYWLRAVLRKGPLLHTTQLRAFLQPQAPLISVAESPNAAGAATEHDVTPFFLPPPSADLILPEHLRIRKGAKHSSAPAALGDDDFEMIEDDSSQSSGGDAPSSIDVADDIIDDELEKINIREREVLETQDRPPLRGSRKAQRKAGSSSSKSGTEDEVSIELNSFCNTSPRAESTAQPPPPQPLEQSSAPDSAAAPSPAARVQAEELVHLHTLFDSMKEKLEFFANYRTAHTSCAESAYFVYTQTHRAFSSNLHALKHERRLLLNLARALEHAILDGSSVRQKKRRPAMQDLLKDPLSDGDDDAGVSPPEAPPAPPTGELIWMSPSSLSAYLSSCAGAAHSALHWAANFVDLSDQAAVMLAERSTRVDSLVAEAERLIHLWIDGDQSMETKAAIVASYGQLCAEEAVFSIATDLTNQSAAAAAPATLEQSLSASSQLPQTLRSLPEKIQGAREFLLSACPFVSESDANLAP